MYTSTLKKCFFFFFFFFLDCRASKQDIKDTLTELTELVLENKICVFVEKKTKS